MSETTDIGIKSLQGDHPTVLGKREKHNFRRRRGNDFVWRQHALQRIDLDPVKKAIRGLLEEYRQDKPMETDRLQTAELVSTHVVQIP